MTEYRVIVLGLGGIGSAAAYWAARRLGDGVLGLEQFEPGHRNGGSEDHSRIIRLSYHTPEYVRLARLAYDAWDAVEADSGEQLVLRTGGLDLALPGAAIGLDDYRRSMTEAGVPFEHLGSEEIMARWPQWRLPNEAEALYQEQSGIAMASRANRTHRDHATRHGARLLATSEVSSISERGGEVVVATAEAVYRAESLIVAAGAWTNRVLAPLGVSLPLEVTQEQVVYLTPRDAASFQPDRFPIFIWMDLPSIYGFPIFGEPAVKVAWDRCELVTDPDTRSHEPRADVIDTVRSFVADYLPAADGPVLVSKTCLYTLTPDRDFIVDRVPGTERVFMAIGAGHGFKFASLLGRTLVELALDGETVADVAPFAADRAILREPNPTRSYLL